MIKNNLYLKKHKIKEIFDISAFRNCDFQASVLKNGCLVSENVFHYLQDPKAYIQKCASCIEGGGLFLLMDCVTDLYDGIINADEYFQDSEHRRFYRVEEVLDMTKAFFRLELFARENESAVFIFSKI